MLLDLPRDVLRGMARSRLRALTLQIETVTWITIPSLLVTCAMFMMYRMSNTPFSMAPIHMWSLSEGLMLPCFLPQA